jgi:hypothetical protein
VQAHCSHKNYRVREQVLQTVMKLCDTYGEDICVIAGICDKVAPLLSDSLNSVRTLAIATLVKLHAIFGSSLLVSSCLRVRGRQIGLV